MVDKIQTFEKRLSGYLDKVKWKVVHLTFQSITFGHLCCLPRLRLCHYKKEGKTLMTACRCRSIFIYFFICFVFSDLYTLTNFGLGKFGCILLMKHPVQQDKYFPKVCGGRWPKVFNFDL